jgi:hypothetical protein
MPLYGESETVLAWLIQVRPCWTESYRWPTFQPPRRILRRPDLRSFAEWAGLIIVFTEAIVALDLERIGTSAERDALFRPWILPASIRCLAAQDSGPTGPIEAKPHENRSAAHEHQASVISSAH